MSVVGKSKIFNDHLVQHLDKSGNIHEGQAGFHLVGFVSITFLLSIN